MEFFWGQDALNGFTQRPFEFAVCKRIHNMLHNALKRPASSSTAKENIEKLKEASQQRLS